MSDWSVGDRLLAARQWSAAMQVCQVQLCAYPRDASAYANLGLALRWLGRLEEAERALGCAVALDSNLHTAWATRGLVATDRCQYEEALGYYDQALLLLPSPVYCFDRALTLLRMGRWEEGWREYRHRWQTERLAWQRPPAVLPWWDGTSEVGRLLIHPEQGLGDTIQCARYLPVLREQGREIVMGAQASLLRLFRWSFPHVQVVGDGDALPDCTHQVMCFDLPGLCAACPTDIRASAAAYLRVDAEVSAFWSWILAVSMPRMPRVGLVWAGSPTHSHAALFRVPVCVLAELALVPDIGWVLLQVGPAMAEGRAWPAPYWNAGEGVSDLADTAAIISGLDLVITVDTSVAHLAGALGVPTWLLLAYQHDWRWAVGLDAGATEGRTPWYAMVRLFRQSHPGDWRPVVARIGGCLRAM